MPGPRQIVPYLVEDDHFIWVPPAQGTTVPVTNITYANDESLGQAIQAIKATDATAGATAIVDFDLSPDITRLTANCGIVSVKDCVVVYGLLAQSLTGQPTLTLQTVSFGAVGAAAAAPVVATVGGSVTKSPASFPVVVPTAGQTYQVQASFGTPPALNTDLQKLVLRTTWPLAVGGSVLICGVFFHATEQIANA